MEVSQISKLTKLKQMQKKEGAASLRPIEDKVLLSTKAVESQKHAHFVALLKEMGEVRMTTTGPVGQVVAQKIYDQLFRT